MKIARRDLYAISIRTDTVAKQVVSFVNGPVSSGACERNRDQHKQCKHNNTYSREIHFM